ncbi:MAG: hypothetical protein ACRD1O_10275 [Terriglobia bacterium]
MAEIKVRFKLIKDVGEAHVTAFPRGARVEFVYLQLRKTIELIAMGSLLANAEMFASIQSNIQGYWKAKDLLKELEALNPDFYPKPIIQQPKKPGVKMEWLDRSDDFLTKDRFITLYDKCGGILHARNPFASEQDFAMLEKAAPKWYLWIVNLLNAHVIRLVGDAKLWLIQMGSDTKPPTYTIFGRSPAAGLRSG